MTGAGASFRGAVADLSVFTFLGAGAVMANASVDPSSDRGLLPLGMAGGEGATAMGIAVVDADGTIVLDANTNGVAVAATVAVVGRGDGCVMSIAVVIISDSSRCCKGYEFLLRATIGKVAHVSKAYVLQCTT